MANQNSKEGSFFLWLIAPLGVALTLLFVNVNGNVAAKRKTLDAAIPAKEGQVTHALHQSAEKHSDNSVSLSNKKFQNTNEAGVKITWQFNSEGNQVNLSSEFQGEKKSLGEFKVNKNGEFDYSVVGEKAEIYKFSFDGSIITAQGKEGAAKKENIIFSEIK